VTGVARFRISPQQSELWAEARSSLHPVTVHTTGLEGVVEAELVDGRSALSMPTHVEVEAQRLRSGNGLVDGELQRRLDVRKFPRIRAEVTRVAPGSKPGTSRLTGELTFHGISRTLDVEVTVRQVDERTLEIEGARAIDMRDFGLPPPSFLMFKMQPEVQVKAKLVAQREV
jgi:polyisoprenoid-binding protein YceI